MATYTKSISADFNGALIAGQFHRIVELNPGFTPNIIGVNTNGDVVTIVFDAPLNPTEETLLQSLANAYTVTFIPSLHIPPLIFNYNNNMDSFLSTNSDVYQIITYFNYLGTDILSNIPCMIDFVVSKDSPTTEDGIAEIIDVTNGSLSVANVSWSSDLIHTERTLSISNVPSGNAIWGIRLKKVSPGVGFIRIHSVVIYH